MTNTHNYSFFGQKSALIIKSSSNSEPYLFIQCLKTHEDGVWEKPSQGEGKVIKLSLEEMAMVLQVLQMRIPKWSAYHSFNDTDTQIRLNWDNSKQKAWFNIGEYRKSLDVAQIEILKLLLKHMLLEKIEFGTSRKTGKNGSEGSNSINGATTRNKTKEYRAKSKPPKTTDSLLNERKKKESKTVIKEEIVETSSNFSNNNVATLTGSIQRETPKALLIRLIDDTELWVPKSKIHNTYTLENGTVQDFQIEAWILEKNKNG
ncbi:MAG: hypothetical protein GF311_12650 [Candidatus Lokiarchaeota archaeon]|nr:hypothetical protein [Candidatus Lokiarchaeota archaeon]